MVDNISSEFLKILSAEALFPELTDSARKFILDQILSLEVLRVFPDGKAQVKLAGQAVVAELDQPLVVGQTLTAKVEQVTPTPVLRILETSSDTQKASVTPAPSNQKSDQPTKIPTDQTSDQTTLSRSFTSQKIDLAILSRNLLNETTAPEMERRISLALREPVGEGELLTESDFKSLNLAVGVEVEGSVSRVIDHTTVMVQINDKQLPVKIFRVLAPGDTVTAKVEKVADYHVLVIQAQKEVVPRLKLVEPSTIKPYLVAKQPFGEMMENLQENLVDNPVLKELKIDPELLGRIKATLKVFLPDGNPIPDANTIKTQVTLSGINYEAKVRKLFVENPEVEVTANKVSLATDLKWQLLKLGNDIEKAVVEAGRSGDRQPASEVLQTVKQATDNIELHQLTNQHAKQEHQPMVLPIPYFQGTDGKTVRLYVKNNGGEGGKNRGGRESISLVFLLNLTALGHLRVDTQVTQDHLAVKICADRQVVSDFIQKHAEELKTRLREAGFKADVSCTRKNFEEMQVEEGLTRFLVKDPSRLVDVKT